MIIQHHRISISQILISSVRIEGIPRITMDCLDTVSVFWVFDWVHACFCQVAWLHDSEASGDPNCKAAILSPFMADQLRSHIEIDSKLITLAVISRCRFGLLGLKKCMCLFQCVWFFSVWILAHVVGFVVCRITLRSTRRCLKLRQKLRRSLRRCASLRVQMIAARLELLGGWLARFCFKKTS
jgi:hypothetical protein